MTMFRKSQRSNISFAASARSGYLMSNYSAVSNSRSIKRETDNLMNIVKTSVYLANWEMDQEEPQGYKDMKSSYYYMATLILFALECFLGAVLPDVDIVFNFIAAIAVSCLGFAFPGGFFLKAEQLFPNKFKAE